MELVAAEVRGGGGAKVKGAGGSEGSGSTSRGGTSPAAAAVAGVAKRRKVDVCRRIDRDCGDASADSACVVQCERCEMAEAEVNSPAVGECFGVPAVARVETERCLSVDVEDPGSASCCSSNESSEVAKKTSELVDLEVKSEEVDETAIQSSFKNERLHHNEEAGADSDDNNMPKPPATASSHQRQLQARMPTQAEIDDFFSVAETNTALRFREKYNFDFEKEEPLKGRYEWKPLIPTAAKEEKIIKA